MSTPWRLRRFNNNRSAGDDEPKIDCRAELCAAGITSPKLLKRWILQNHPDKICHFDTSTDAGKQANDDCFRKTNGRYIVVSDCGKTDIPNDCDVRTTTTTAKPIMQQPAATTNKPPPAAEPTPNTFPFSKADEPSKQQTYEDFKQANTKTADADDENPFQRRKQAAIARSVSKSTFRGRPVFDIDKPPDFSKLSATKTCAWITAASAAIDDRRNRCDDSYAANLRDLEDDIRRRIGNAATVKIDELKTAAAASVQPALLQKTAVERKSAAAAVYASYVGPDAATNAFARAEIAGRLQTIERRLAELQPAWLAFIRSSINTQLNERISAVRLLESKNVDAAIKNLRQSTANNCAASADRLRLALRTKLSSVSLAARLGCPDLFI